MPTRAAPGSPRALVWHWDALLAGTRRGYFALSLRAPPGAAAAEVCPLPGDASAPPRLAPLPPAAEALLLADAVGIAVSLAGAPRGNPLAFGSPPLALAHTHPYVLALASDRRSLEVWDRAAAARVQRLQLGSAPGADAPGGVPSLADDGACGGGGSAAAAALGRALLLLRAPPLEAQARELLRGRAADAALALADAAAAAAQPPGTPPPWLDTLHAECEPPCACACLPACVHPTASADAHHALPRAPRPCHVRIGFQRLAEGAWGAATLAWAACAGFEPAELFPLFPAQAGPFRDAAPLKRYWCAPQRQRREAERVVGV